LAVTTKNSHTMLVGIENLKLADSYIYIYIYIKYGIERIK